MVTNIVQMEQMKTYVVIVAHGSIQNIKFVIDKYFLHQVNVVDTSLVQVVYLLRQHTQKTTQATQTAIIQYLSPMALSSILISRNSKFILMVGRTNVSTI